MIDKNSTLLYTIKEMNIKQTGIAIIEDNGNIEGIITNRDLFKYIEKNNNITYSVEDLINKNYYYIDDDELYIKDVKKMYTYIPVVKNKKLLGIFDQSIYEFK